MLDKLIGAALQGLGGQGAAANPLMQVIGALLNNGGPGGGLAGLIQQFQQAGLGQVVASWISTGQNLPISAEQLAQVFGGGQLQKMAEQAGMAAPQFSAQLSDLLPQLVDQLTPNGALPTGGAEDALAMLSKLSRG